MTIDAGLYPKLISIVMGSQHSDVRREGTDNNSIYLAYKVLALWAISNALTGGNSSQIEHIVDRGFIDVVIHTIQLTDAKNSNVVLDGFNSLLNTLKKHPIKEDLAFKYPEDIN
jgi:hypothetical protein